jgi:hypothetical protein
MLTLTSMRLLKMKVMRAQYLITGNLSHLFVDNTIRSDNSSTASVHSQQNSSQLIAGNKYRLTCAPKSKAYIRVQLQADHTGGRKGTAMKPACRFKIQL